MTDALERLPELLMDAVFMVEEGGRIVFVNPACQVIFGYAPEEMVGRVILDFIHPDDQARTVAEMGQVLNGRPGLGFENRYLRKDGSVAHIMWSARWSAQDRLRIGVARDISERKLAEQRQAGMLALATAAHGAETLPELFRAVERILQELLPLRAMAVLLQPGDRLAYSSARTGAGVGGAAGWHHVTLSGSGIAFGEMRLDLGRRGALSAKEIDLLEFTAGQAGAVIERLALHADLAHAARYDELTGLPNRRLFQDRILSAIARCRRGQSRGALLFIDLDDFKQVNDECGHVAGDQLLQAIARRITSCVREADTVARIGGDEFVALLENVADQAQAAAVAGKIRQVIATPLLLAGRTLQPHASIGIALYPEHGEVIDQLMRHADQAMYAAKALRKAAAAD
ncbi:diguanylate cyclase domain-containing protein [Pseudoduganella violaceinigra]|uniref:diguanylate cyclase domain-containing protein n=1 Tax=Pseudoduganella violaceinigra TaxID=246602 RepID=UPI0004283279|nr:diguanylate cyclase [Pseudoduganella violaceinigra]